MVCQSFLSKRIDSRVACEARLYCKFIKQSLASLAFAYLGLPGGVSYVVEQLDALYTDGIIRPSLVGHLFDVLVSINHDQAIELYSVRY